MSRAKQTVQPAYRLEAGCDPHPDEAGWQLEVYNWDESTGIAECTYSHARDSKKSLLVEVEQPANPYQVGWSHRLEYEHEYLLQRYFDSMHETLLLQAKGAYGR